MGPGMDSAPSRDRLSLTMELQHTGKEAMSSLSLRTIPSSLKSQHGSKWNRKGDQQADRGLNHSSSTTRTTSRRWLLPRGRASPLHELVQQPPSEPPGRPNHNHYSWIPMTISRSKKLMMDRGSPRMTTTMKHFIRIRASPKRRQGGEQGRQPSRGKRCLISLTTTPMTMRYSKGSQARREGGKAGMVLRLFLSPRS